jgi:hypothetical protein
MGHSHNRVVLNSTGFKRYFYLNILGNRKKFSFVNNVGTDLAKTSDYITTMLSQRMILHYVPCTRISKFQSFEQHTRKVITYLIRGSTILEGPWPSHTWEVS